MTLDAIRKQLQPASISGCSCGKRLDIRIREYGPDRVFVSCNRCGFGVVSKKSPVHVNGGTVSGAIGLWNACQELACGD